VLFMEVGRRAGLEILGMGLPGHFCVGARVDDELVLLDPFGTFRGSTRGARTGARPSRSSTGSWSSRPTRRCTCAIAAPFWSSSASCTGAPRSGSAT
jgi:hypothetical protein